MFAVSSLILLASGARNSISVTAYAPNAPGITYFHPLVGADASNKILPRRRRLSFLSVLPFPKPEIISQRNNFDSTTSLYHMGHSHSHHDHSHHHDHPVSNGATLFNKEKLIRKLALVLVCWVVTCGTKLAQTKRLVGLSQTDWISFLITSFALTSANKIKSTIQKSVDNFREFVDGIKKHSSITMMEAHDHDHRQFEQSQVDKAEADRVTWIGVAVNLLLSVGKLGAGITAHSSALVADAGHSLSDLVSDFITLWSVNVARLPPDEDHPYGHYKFEAIGSLFLSLTLLATGGSVGLMANKQLMEVLQATSTASTAAVQVPGPLALVMAGLSIFSKEWLFRITKQVGERLRSPVVIANAWHHRSDAYSSVLALLSIAWAMVGFPAADAAAGILVAGMICMTGGEIMVESVKQLSDSADSDLQTEIMEILDELDDDDVISTISVRARQMGSAASVDAVVEIPSILSTTATTAVEQRVRQRLLGELAERRSSSSGIIVSVTAKPFLEIPTQMGDDDSESFAKLAFEKFDENSDGILTVGELKLGLEKTLNIELSDDRVQKLLDEFDVNKDGYLDLEEMVTIDEFRAKIEAFSREEKKLAMQVPNLLDEMPSTTYIEQQVRNQAKLMYPKIHSVEGVTVHYTSQNSVNVDVNIRIRNENGTNALGRIREYAQELKDNLETELQEIETARVYLDLNPNDDSASSPTSTLNITTVPNLAP